MIELRERSLKPQTRLVEAFATEFATEFATDRFSLLPTISRVGSTFSRNCCPHPGYTANGAATGAFRCGCVSGHTLERVCSGCSRDRLGRLLQNICADVERSLRERSALESVCADALQTPSARSRECALESASKKVHNALETSARTLSRAPVRMSTALESVFTDALESVCAQALESVHTLSRVRS